MTKYAAFIRGIGPGDPRKTNEKLRGVLESLELSNVQSVISSGNIIFESDETNVGKLEVAIEAAWPERLGFEAATIVRSQSQLQHILDDDPFDGVQHGKGAYLLVTFLKHPVEPQFSIPYQPGDKSYKVVGYTGDTVFTITDNTAIKTTELMTWLERQFGKGITSRTPLTIERIIKKMSLS